MLDSHGIGKDLPLAMRARPLVFACDAAFAMPLATALTSLSESKRSNEPWSIRVLSEDFPDAMRAKVLASLPAHASIEWVPVDLARFREFSTLNYISSTTYARLLLPWVFPESVKKVLYLDADILVLDDLEELWNADLQGGVVGAVLDGLDPDIKSNVPGLERVPRVQNYFNAGLLLIDLEAWRRERISEKAIAYMAQHPASPYSDQDALNVACDGRWTRLPPRWNLQAHVETRIEDMRPELRPAIVHFVSRLKPWRASSLSLNAALYDAVRNRTRFARTRTDRLWDGMVAASFRCRRAMSRYAFLRAIWTAVRRPRRGGPVPGRQRRTAASPPGPANASA